jgi:hypothetical protein
VAETRTDDLDDVSRRCLFRCGDCGTWRGMVLGVREARALERRCSRRLRRDRRELERMLWLLERADASRVLVRYGATLERTPPGPDGFTATRPRPR